MSLLTVPGYPKAGQRYFGGLLGRTPPLEMLCNTHTPLPSPQADRAQHKQFEMEPHRLENKVEILSVDSLILDDPWAPRSISASLHLSCLVV